MLMLRFEWKKLWGNKALVGMLVACFFLNGAFLYWQMGQYNEEARCFPEEIAKVYEEVETVPREEKVEWLLNEVEKEIESEMPNYRRRNALNVVTSHIQETLDYEGYLASMEEQANQIAHSALFSDMDSFSKRNAAQIPKQYEHLHGLVLEPENSQGVLAATESGMTDLFLMVIVILFSYFVICVEREEGTMEFVHCTVNGAKRLGRVKMLVIFTGTVLSTLILYGTNVVLAGMQYGLGDLGRWIQSVDGYLGSPWNISVGMYFVWFFIGKIVITVVFAALVVWVLLKGRSILESSLGLAVIVAAEYLLYSKIESLSWLSILKQCNLFYLLGTNRFLESYYTVNLFNHPVSSLLVCSGFGMMLLLYFVVQSIRCYETVSRMEYTMKRRKWKLPTFSLKPKEGKRIWQYEAKKILRIHKAGALFLLFLVILVGIYQDKVQYYTEDEIYYRYYIKQVEGIVTEEKLEFLKTEGEHIDKSEEQLKRKTGYEWVCMQSERIGEDGMFLDEVAFGRLLDKNEFLKNIGMLLIVFVLAFYPVFVTERISGMDTIWNSIPNGRKKITVRKWMVLVVYIAIICILSDAVILWHEMRLLDIVDLNVPIQYLTGFETWKGISVLFFLIGRCLIKMILGMGVAGVTALVSKKAKNTTTVLLVSAGVVGICYVIGSIIYLR